MPGTVAPVPNTFDNILIGLVVLTWLMWRQLQARRADRPPVVLLVISALGAAALGAAIAKTTPTSAAILLLIAGFAVAGGFGVARGYTMRIWRTGGTPWRGVNPALSRGFAFRPTSNSTFS
ncbi:hypothetical protein G3I59_43205 [Amycolatopsis rubida]|uniref:Uncharacterized protein n=1 Tax=Amycolatopsis rubida TaxID=112413 RepID=A0ABX0C385_9PSEU|nr:hypothetical protein [Amycolatopsis rubida]OAP24684.1 hypothetical protein A4R44_04653 [Amycolatopsis sp. M39]